MILTKEQIEEFEKLARLMMEFLSKTGHPYAKAIIDIDKAEFVTSSYGTGFVDDYIQD
jgi:hypothetical protein